MPGTKRRELLFDEEGNRNRGKENKDQVQLAHVRIKLANGRVWIICPDMAAPPPAFLKTWVNSLLLRDIRVLCGFSLGHPIVSGVFNPCVVWGSGTGFLCLVVAGMLWMLGWLVD